MLTKKNNFIFLIALCVVTLHSCTCNQSNKRADISAVPVKLEVKRFEQDLFRIDSIPNGISGLKSKYGDFLDLFTFQITTIGSKDSLLTQQRLLGFVADTNFRKIYSDCEALYGDFSSQEKK